ncbi:hypothetical protein EBZ80_15710 [bacterium]|nr:hypothetical protein [bacterium]
MNKSNLISTKTKTRSRSLSRSQAWERVKASKEARPPPRSSPPSVSPPFPAARAATAAPLLA